MELRVTNVGRSDGKSEVEGGSIYLVGDRIYAFTSNRLLSVFSFRTNEWRDFPSTESRLLGFGHSGDLVNEKIYITGGSTSVVEFDLLLESLSKVETSRPTGPLDRMSMTALYADWRREIVFFGGYNRTPGANLFGHASLSNETYSFNVDSLQWQLVKMKGTLPLPRSGHAAVMRGFNMYVFGGYNYGVGYIASISVAHLSGRQQPHWTMPQIEGMVPHGRIRATLNNLDGYLLVFGGFSRIHDVKTTFDLYCVRTRKWRTGASAAQARLDPKRFVGIVGSRPKPKSYPLGVEISDGALIFTADHIQKITL